jgi:radical SAM superfamily enzyme YgiQ (UPF0313 family)
MMARTKDRKALLAGETGLRPAKSGKLRMALCYPNTYETGMSNLGFLTIYRLANQLPGMKCERAFHGVAGGKTLETGKRIGKFDIVGVSVSYELDYPRTVGLLGDSGIPLLREERNDSDPLVIAGGPAVSLNPMPLSPFFDVFFLGEAEESFSEFVNLLGEVGYARKGGWRRELLKRASGIRGTFVPEISTHPKRRWVARLENHATHSPIITPNSHFRNMYLVEVERGCPRGCRFCAATYLYRPFRIKSAASIMDTASEPGFGFSRIGLVGAGLSDHPDIERMCMAFAKQGKEVGVSSLRPDNMTPNLISTLSGTGLRSVTMAPEAGSQRMRNVVGKPITEARILESAGLCQRSGLQGLRLYFMIGLPFETVSDVEAIAQLVSGVSGEFKKRISVRLSPFVPKAQTPFQWEPIADPAALRDKVGDVKKRLRSKRNVTVESRSPRESGMEMVFSRGDERVGSALLHWYKYRNWKRAFKSAGVDVDDLIRRKLSRKDRLPWDFIDASVPKSLLWAELSRAKRAAT